MSRQASVRTTTRIAHDVRLRKAAGRPEPHAGREFRAGEWVRSVTLIRNDGVYPHKDIGEPLVYPGDTGTVQQSWRFLGDVYYTVEFMARAVFVIMRGREMESAAERVDLSA
ncbi:nitrogen fixation protein NifZ [Bradyrhizobium sp.]|uniref:nitrogen fixation protein NifZ n=1 Tax=Bradyrhizobium sp. TaxID=376 RepID=UPI002D230728|nr:nitrogen fixation protein NifZ [Bradyrhizobium sp.]HZR73796.1 nitrogen fixation protein NifZ [Bradyrhizobium sp.]